MTLFYQCVQDHYETLEQVYPERFEKRYGFWRPYLKEVMVHFLSCGDLHEGFLRIRCDACGTERLLAFSCKERKTDHPLLRRLCEFHSGQAAKAGSRGTDSDGAGAGVLLKGSEEKLVPFDPEGLRDGPLGLSPMPEPHESHCLD